MWLSREHLHRSASIAAFLIALAPMAAVAQSAATDRIDAIERQIKGLQNELQQLKGELGETKRQLSQARAAAASAQRNAVNAKAAESNATQAAAQARAAVAAAPPPAAAKPQGPHPVQTAGNRFGIESADGRNSIYLTGRLQFDAGDYMDYHAGSKFAAVQNLTSGVNARRARLGVTGKFGGDWAYTLIYDFGGSSDGLPPTAGAPVSGVQTAQITYNGLAKAQYPLFFDVGYLKVPFTLEQATSSNDMPFVERPSAQAIAAGIMGGSARSALGVRSNNDRYFTGLYLTGPTSGALHGASKTNAEQIGATGRATYQILQNPEYSLHLGVNGGGLLKPPTVGGVQTITLADRPELRVDPTAILTTTGLGAAVAPVTNAAVYGVEAAGGWRNFFLQGEYYHIDVNYVGTPSNGFDGGYVEGSWTLTGEQRKYNPATGAYLGIVPARAFSPWDGQYGIGAWELAGRYSTIDLNDACTPTALVIPANLICGGRQTVYAGALNWYPTNNIRFMFDYLHGNVSKNFAFSGGGSKGTPFGAPIGGNFDAVVLRSQFAF